MTLPKEIEAVRASRDDDKASSAWMLEFGSLRVTKHRDELLAYINTLTAENARLRACVEQCIFKFDAYEAIHKAKGDAEGKAAANRAMADMCRAALTPEDPANGI